MSLIRQFVDLMLEIPAGNVPGKTSIEKFGRATNLDTNTDTDIWDRANATDDQAIWVAPTTARTHDIVSTSTDDDGSPVGDGARTVEISGLTAWNTAETSEVITMNGTTDVPTASAYVIIHRMEVLTKGATDVNVGVITATAQTDGTVTAQINAGQGNTQMAIYGVPSTQTAYMTGFYIGILRASGATAIIDFSLLSNMEPDAELLNFSVRHKSGLSSAASSDIQHFFMPYKKFVGPTIIKMQGNGSALNLDANAGFDLIIEDN